MTRLCLTAMLAVWPAMAPADTSRGTSALPVRTIEANTLDSLRWQSRPVIVLGEGADGQIATLQDQAGALAERDVILLTDGAGAAALRPDTGLRVLLIGKDGGIKLDRDTPVSVQQIIDLIDTMPMRRREAG